MIIAIYLMLIAALIYASIGDIRDRQIPFILFPVCQSACLVLNIIYIVQLPEYKLAYILSLVAGAVLYTIIITCMWFMKLMGSVDILMVLCIGTSLGFFRTTEILIIACIVGLIMFIIRKIRKKKLKEFPFAPMLLIGTGIDFIFYIINTYC